MTDSTSGSFMDGHGTGVRARDPIETAINDLDGWIAILCNLNGEDLLYMVQVAGQIESLAAGLVQELTILSKKEVLRREREWNKAKGNDPTAVEPEGPVCEACKGTGVGLDLVDHGDFTEREPCSTCDGKGWRPPTYEEEWIDPRSGLPRAHENPHVPKE